MEVVSPNVKPPDHVRNRLLATIWLLWFAAAAAVVFWTVNSSTTSYTYIGPPAGANPSPGAFLRQACSIYWNSDCVPFDDYATGSAVVAIGIATALAALASAVVFVWTRSKREDNSNLKVGEQRERQDPYSSPARTAREITATPPSRGSPHPGDTASTADSLRELKLLHEEGILTDDEYSAKRQSLADKL